MSVELTPLEIKGHRLTAQVLALGASLSDLRLDWHAAPLVLGLSAKDQRENPQFYMGAVIGRHANRIGYGQASINGQALDLSLNSPPHHSAGGVFGFSRKIWTVERHDATELCLSLTSPDGEEGYPGEIKVTATYTIKLGAILCLTYEACASEDTILNMCHHPYFNLDDSETVEHHVLEIPAAQYLPCDETVLPCAGPTPVRGGTFDFTTPRAVGHHSEQIYNNTYCLSDASTNPLTFAARLTGAKGLSMEVWTTQAGLHLYNGYKLLDCPPGIDGRRYLPGAGICLEAQNWPDSPNNPSFPTSVLKKDKLYKQVTEYRFPR